jgi:hypothetical protein
MSYVDVDVDVDVVLQPQVPPMRNGAMKTFHPNGMLKTMATYRNNKLICSGTRFYNNGIVHTCKKSPIVTKNSIGMFFGRPPSDVISVYVFFDTSGRPHGHQEKNGDHSHWFHGAPARYFLFRDEYIHQLWIRVGIHHVFLRFIRTAQESSFNLHLYAPSPKEFPPFIAYGVKFPHKNFAIYQTDNQYECDIRRRYKRKYYPKIYIKRLLAWYDIPMPHGPYVYESIGEEILRDIEDHNSISSIVSGLLRFLSAYGVYFPTAKDPLQNLISVADPLLEKIDDGPRTP